MSAPLWQALLREPAHLPDDVSFAAWFDAIAVRLLNGSRLLVRGEPHRITEVEFYYHGGGHRDPFTHRDPIQKSTGRWYFHRTGGGYRGGSFKGFDLTFGGGEAFGGVLIRGLEPDGGDPIDGPSLSVDHLIARTAAGTVAALDRSSAGLPAWDPANTLSLAWLDDPDPRPVLRTARVGLSLKRAAESADALRFLLRRYRQLSQPLRTAKGKLHMVLALYADGHDLDAVREWTGCTAAALRRYAADFDAGRDGAGFDAYNKGHLGPRELARLHGLWHCHFGGT